MVNLNAMNYFGHHSRFSSFLVFSLFYGYWSLVQNSNKLILIIFLIAQARGVGLLVMNDVLTTSE